MNECFITNTSYIIPKRTLTQEGLLTLKSRLSVIEFKTKNEIPKAFFDFGEVIMIPKIDPTILFACIKKQLKFTPWYIDERKVPVDTYKLKYKPLPFQVKLLEDAKRVFDTQTDKRVCVTLAPGNGKTYISANIIDHLRCKFLFIVYSGTLVQQGLKNLEEFLDAKGLIALTQGSDLFDLKYDKINGIFMTHAMLRTLVKDYGWDRIADILCNKIGITMKVCDEFDREVGFTYQLECMMLFRYSLYLTGTPFKSLKTDDRIFQAIYRKANILGRDIKVEPNKSIIYLNFKSSPSPAEYTIASRDQETFKIYYNNFLGKKDIHIDYILENLYHPERSLMKNIINAGRQIVIFCGRIDSCEVVKNKLVKNHSIDENIIGILNSSIKNPKHYEEAKNKSIIVTTCQTLGRGYDSKNIQMLIFLEFHFSKSETIQSISRVGRVGGYAGYVVYPIDHSFISVIRAFESKAAAGIFKEQFKTSYQLPTMSNEFLSKYYYGYRKDSEEAKQIAAVEAKRKKNLSFRDKMKYV